MIALKDLLKDIFSEDIKLTEKQSVVFGQANLVCAGKEPQLIHILGVKESTFFGVEHALIMAQKIIELLESQSKAPLLLIVDVAGQELTMRDEWLGMHEYFAHLLASLECLRHQGNPIISLISNQALGGAFIAYGMMADTILALPDAALAVMWLEGIAKVTKIDLAKLQALSKTVPVLSPGVRNFYVLGGLHEIVTSTKLKEKIGLAIATHNKEDERAHLGYERKGRMLAWPIINKVIHAYEIQPPHTG